VVNFTLEQYWGCCTKLNCGRTEIWFWADHKEERWRLWWQIRVTLDDSNKNYIQKEADKYLTKKVANW